jgi:hypothetical protein
MVQLVKEVAREPVSPLMVARAAGISRGKWNLPSMLSLSDSVSYIEDSTTGGILIRNSQAKTSNSWYRVISPICTTSAVC